jgi:hypothetical protein
MEESACSDLGARQMEVAADQRDFVPRGDTNEDAVLC